MREWTNTERNWHTAEPRDGSRRYAGEQYHSESQQGENAFAENQSSSQGSFDPSVRGGPRGGWEGSQGQDPERGSWEGARSGWREGYGGYGTGARATGHGGGDQWQERGGWSAGSAHRPSRYEGPPGYTADAPGFEGGFQKYGGSGHGYGEVRGGGWAEPRGREQQGQQGGGGGWRSQAGADAQSGRASQYQAGLDAQSGRAGQWYGSPPSRGFSSHGAVGVPYGRPGFGYGGGVTGYGEWGGLGEHGPYGVERGQSGYGAPWGTPVSAQQGGYRGEEGGAGRDWSDPGADWGGGRAGSAARGGWEERGGWQEPGGYREPWSVPGPFTGRGPLGYQRSETAIHEDVCERLTRHGELDASGIQVRVDRSEVILEGTVSDRRAKRMAEETAESVAGVRDVQNRLRVSERDDPSHRSGIAARDVRWDVDDDEAEPATTDIERTERNRETEENTSARGGDSQRAGPER